MCKLFLFGWRLLLTIISTKGPTHISPANRFINSLPRGPREASKCREAKIAVRKFLPVTCRAITLTAGAILKEEKIPSLVEERQFGRYFKRQFGRGKLRVKNCRETGSFLLTTELFCLQLCLGVFCFSHFEGFNLQFELFCLQLSFFAYCGKVCLSSTSTDCKQRSSTVSKKHPTVSKKTSPFINRVHAEGVVLREGTCFCLL